MLYISIAVKSPSSIGPFPLPFSPHSHRSLVHTSRFLLDHMRSLCKESSHKPTANSAAAATGHRSGIPQPDVGNLGLAHKLEEVFGIR